jgi:hypothetical protein
MVYMHTFNFYVKTWIVVWGFGAKKLSTAQYMYKPSFHNLLCILFATSLSTLLCY